MAEKVRLFFDAASASSIDAHQNVDIDHGRIESRGHRVSREVDWFAGDRLFPGEPGFPDLADVAMFRPRSGATAEPRWPDAYT